MRERGVPERPLLLGEPDRLAAHLEHQRLGDRQERLGGVTPKAVPTQALEVDGGAGERQRRVQRERQRAGGEPPARAPPGRAGRRCARPACRAAARRSRPARSTRSASASSGTVSSTRSARAHDLVDGQRPARPAAAPRPRAARRVGDGRDGDDRVAGPAQGRAQHRADAAGADDAHAQAGRARGSRAAGRPSCRSSPREGYRTCTVQRACREQAASSACVRDHRCPTLVRWTPLAVARGGRAGAVRPRRLLRPRERPAGHFRTSVTATPVFADGRARAGRAASTTRWAGRTPSTSSTSGAGGGELLHGAARRAGALAADRRRARARPRRPALRWTAELPEVEGLLLANEWLDAVPLDVAVRRPGRRGRGRRHRAARRPASARAARVGRALVAAGPAGRGRADPRPGLGRRGRAGAPRAGGRRRLRPRRSATGPTSATGGRRSPATATAGRCTRCSTAAATSPPTSRSTRASRRPAGGCCCSARRWPRSASTRRRRRAASRRPTRAATWRCCSAANGAAELLDRRSLGLVRLAGAPGRASPTPAR